MNATCMIHARTNEGDGQMRVVMFISTHVGDTFKMNATLAQHTFPWIQMNYRGCTTYGLSFRSRKISNPRMAKHCEVFSCPLTSTLCLPF